MPESASARFTVCTPTYNRAHTLSRVFERLRAQTLQDFEWIVVDDGSTDETADMVQGWARGSPFALRYVRQPRGGKHRAMNRAVQMARGELFLPLDSDDEPVPRAVERLAAYWEEIPADRRPGYTGVTVLAQDESGRIVGDRFPQERMDLDFVTMTTRYRIGGDKWGFHRTEVLRQFPFPEFEGELFLPESVVWYRIARVYTMRFVNDPLLVVHYQPDGLSAPSTMARARSPRGAMLFYRELGELGLGWSWRFRAAANGVRYALHAGWGVGRAVRESGRPWRAGVAFPVGAALWARDRLRSGG